MPPRNDFVGRQKSDDKSRAWLALQQNRQAQFTSFMQYPAPVSTPLRGILHASRINFNPEHNSQNEFTRKIELKNEHTQEKTRMH